MVDYTQPGAKKRAKKCLDELFRWVIASGGAISGEHGIGLAKKRWWPQADFKRSARTSSRRETRARPEGHFESRQVRVAAGVSRLNYFSKDTGIS
jgi:glycolate oxidase